MPDPLFIRFVPDQPQDLSDVGDGLDGARVRTFEARVEIESDAFGAETVYVARLNGSRQGTLCISDSVRRLVIEGAVSGELNRERAVRALVGSLDPSETIFEGVECLPTGHAITLDGRSVRVEARASLPSFEPDPLTRSLDDYRIQLRYLLRQAVSRRLGAGTGVLLSGGLDSAGLLAIASDVRRGRVTAVTLAGEDGDDEELARARQVAGQLQADHLVVRVSEAALPGAAPEAIRAYEGLICNGLAVAKFLFHRKGSGPPALLSGVGADEVLAGNPEMILPAPGELPAYLDAQEDDVALTRVLLTRDALALVPALQSDGPPRELDPLGWSQALFLRTVLPQATIPAECRTARASGVSVRLPYLDRDVVKFCSSLPRALRERDGTGKVLLRLLFEGVLPPEILRQPKVARLVPPGGLDPRAQSGWLHLYDDYLAASPDPLGIVDLAKVRALLDSYKHLAPTHRHRIVADRVLLRLLSLAVLGRTRLSL